MTYVPWGAAVDPAYVVRVWLDAARMDIELVAHAAAIIAAHSMHIQVLGVSSTPSEHLIRLRVYAMDMIEAMATFSAAVAGMQREIPYRPGVARRVTFEPVDPGAPLRDASGDRLGQRTDGTEPHRRS